MVTSAAIKQRAKELRFDLAGIASRDRVDGDEFRSTIAHYKAWIDGGHAASMSYLSRHLEKKANPDQLLAGWQSIVCVGLRYAQDRADDTPARAAAAQVSLYTKHEDYHDLIEQKLKSLAQTLAGAHYVIFVDAQAVMERFWASQAGLGWIGKNTNLINRKLGSFFFLGGLITTAKLDVDTPEAPHCGKCTKCIEACPTQAIRANNDRHFVDSNRCIAYHTIENRGLIPTEVMAKMDRWVGGCDICQTVCPWNDPLSKEPLEFHDTNPAFAQRLDELAGWTSDEYKLKMNNTAMRRQKYYGFLRNLAIATANSSTIDRKDILQKIASRTADLGTSEKRVVEETVKWAQTKE